MPTTTAIENELLKATNVRKNQGETRNDYILRLMRAVSGAEDSVWEGLSQAAQDWANETTKAHNAGKSLPPFPDEPTAADAAQEPAEQPGEDDPPKQPEATAEQPDAEGDVDPPEPPASEETEERTTSMPATETASRTNVHRGAVVRRGRQPTVVAAPARRGRPPTVANGNSNGHTAARRGRPPAVTKTAPKVRKTGDNAANFMRKLIIKNPNIGMEKLTTQTHAKFPDTATNTIHSMLTATRALLRLIPNGSEFEAYFAE